MQGKDLEEVIQSLRIFNKILVTRPQRSGTTIAAQIIAANSSMPCVDEKEYGWRSASYQRKLYRGKVPYPMHLVTPICIITHLHWHHHQKVLIPHYCDLSYASLSSHPRWIKPVQRSAFNAK